MPTGRSSRARSRDRSTPPTTPDLRKRALQVSPSGSTRTASSSATGSRRWPGTPGGTLKPGTASWASARVYHTVNPRLFPEQIVWIVNHAEDRIVMTDLTFVPLLEKLADKMPSDRALRRADRRRAYAGDHAEECRRLRRLDRRSRRRLRVGIVRRKYGGRHVLHVGHDRQSRRACSIRTARTCSTR